jgi:hypothetical protein
MAEPHTIDETVNWPTISGFLLAAPRSVITNGRAVAWAACAFRERTICR